MSLARLHLELLPGESERVMRRAAIVLQVAEQQAKVLHLPIERLATSPLAGMVGEHRLPDALIAKASDFAMVPPALDEREGDLHLRAAHRIGEVLDLLLAVERGGERRKLGSYYTPPTVARSVIETTLSDWELPDASLGLPAVCDPACGGGAFLLEAAFGLEQRFLSQTQEKDAPHLRTRIVENLWGLDLSELAIATVQVALAIFARLETSFIDLERRFVVGDALVGSVFGEACEGIEILAEEEGGRVDYHQTFPSLFSGDAPSGFAWLVGNPPWVAFQGRATQKITVRRREYYRRNFRAFRGYPTLHGLFVERATQLAAGGRISLLIPSSVSDLEGYESTRSVLRQGHQPQEPLVEFGQDAFVGVVQPCFGLVAKPTDEATSPGDSSRPWKLSERTRMGSATAPISVPSVLQSLSELALLPHETFREMGFQSNRIVAQELFHRGEAPLENFCVPLLEGRRVAEFQERSPGLFLHPEQQTLRQTGCRLRSPEVYESVQVVVRQTAAFTIAARHEGAAFRNSLIAAFSTEAADTTLLLGLLNSALFRALHLSRQRDARQAAFPQVKLSHLRSLPCPPDDDHQREMVRVVSKEASRRGGLTEQSRRSLDDAVFSLFGFSAEQALEVRNYLSELSPAALRPSLADS